MDKKGQELSANIIIIAIIALIVLVVLVAIFTGRISVFNIGLQDCEQTGGVCDEDCSFLSEQTGMEYVEDKSKTCFADTGEVDEFAVCCRKI